MPSDLLEEISKLRGSISNYKKEITSNQPYAASYTRGSFRGRGRGRGAYRGARGGFPVRNRTLIVQGDSSGDYVSVMTSNGNKLVNRELYEKELKAKNLTKQEKQTALNEKKMLITQRKMELRVSKNRAKLDHCDWCLIDGQTFAISRYGARLVLLDIPDDSERSSSVMWNNHEYKRTPAGNLKMLNQKVFLKEQCRYFEKTGMCAKMGKCKYTHNKAKVMLCPKFIKGQCTLRECPLSHEPNEFNIALCRFYLSGNCKNEHCPFLHVQPESELICRRFAVGGYCFRGNKCKFKHVHDCPDWQLRGKCPRGRGCRLSHRQGEDTVGAKLEYKSLDSTRFQLPDLTTLDDIHGDPRIIQDDIEEEGHLSDTDESDTESHLDQTEDLEVNADFVHF